jgi:hypothetical protein
MMRWLLCALVIVFAATSAWLWHSREAERQHLQTMPLEQGVTVDKATGASKADAATGRLASPGPASAIGKSTADTPQPDESRHGFAPEVAARLADDDTYLAAMRRAKRLAAIAQYPDLARVLSISRETEDRLLTLLADQKADAFQFGLLPPSPAKASSELELEEQEREQLLESNIRALIGGEKLDQFRTYRASLFERYMVRGLQVELMNSEIPLAFEEAEPVIQAMYEERKEIERELTATHGASDASDEYPVSFIVKGKEIASFDPTSNARIFAAAARELSPAQAQAFRRMLDNGTSMTDAISEMNRTGAKARTETDN